MIETKRLAGAAGAIAAAALALAACGHAGAPPSSGARTAAAATGPAHQNTVPEYARVDADKDNDVQAPADDTNNNSALFGHEAAGPERRTIATLVRRYYAIALAGDGTKACSMIYSTLAESVPEDYGTNEPPGPPYMKGTTCPTVLNGLLGHMHAQLAAEVPLLRITHVRLIEHHGIALLAFGPLPERQIDIKREGRTWRIDALLDRELS
jgi:hypothetical protein